MQIMDNRPFDLLQEANRFRQFMESETAEERSFWTCPYTGLDCRNVRLPALAIIRDGRNGPAVFQMYADIGLAEDKTPHSFMCWPGMPAVYLVEKWLHYSGKPWIEAAGLASAMRRLTWQFVADLHGRTVGAKDA